MKPLVSVIIPTYNRARDLERAMKSVIAQTYDNWELVIVDNHSSDNTEDVVKGFDDRRIRLFKIHNGGVIAASRNLGIKHARGDYVAFLDSDDWWKPQKLEISVKYLEQGADVVYHDLFVAKRTRQKLFWKKDVARELMSPVLNDLLLQGNALKNSSVVARTTILRAIGGLSEDHSLVTMEDYDAWLRAARITEKFRLIPETLGYYWAGGGNSHNPEKTLKAIDALEKKYAEVLNHSGRGAGTWWSTYSKARAYYELGKFTKAKALLVNGDFSQAPFAVRIKTLAMILRLHFVQHDIQ